MHHHHHGLTDVANEATSAGSAEPKVCIQVLGVISSLKKSMWICKKDRLNAYSFEFLAASDRTMVQQKILLKFLSVYLLLDPSISRDIFRAMFCLLVVLFLYK